MPCSDCGPSACEIEADKQKLKDRCDHLARMLCWLCGESFSYVLFARNPELETWWAEHQVADTERVLREMRKSPITSFEVLAERFIREAEKVHSVSNYHKRWFIDLAVRACKEREQELKELNKQKAIRDKALRKLSLEERRALGLK